MLDWQSLAVVAIVAAAVVFLISRFVVPPRRRRKPGSTFVPLSAVKKRQDRCH
jgi:predicted MFS family arabinose efflux permease